MAFEQRRPSRGLSVGGVDDDEPLESLLNNLEDNDCRVTLKLSSLNKLILCHDRFASEFHSLPLFPKAVGYLIGSDHKTIRTAALRVLRMYMTPLLLQQLTLNLKLGYFISRCMEREKGDTVERVEAIKLVRDMFKLNPSLIPIIVMRSLISIANSPLDGFSRVCLETVAEIALQNLALVAVCNGIKALFCAAVNPFHQASQHSLIATILYLLEEPSTRCYIRPNSDIRNLFQPFLAKFTEETKEEEDIEIEKRWESSMSAVVGMVRSWTGLLCIAADHLALKSMVDALYLPHPKLQEIILGGLFTIFRLEIPRDLEAPFDRIKSSQDSAQRPGPGEIGVGTIELPSRTYSKRPNLVNNYLSMLLLVFIRCGLIEALISIGRTDNPLSNGDLHRSIVAKATILLAEILHMATEHLPPSNIVGLQTLPTLMNLAISFNSQASKRCKASAMVSELHQFAHIKGSHDSEENDTEQLSMIVTGAGKWRRVKGNDRRLDRIDDIKRKMDWDMDTQEVLDRIQRTEVEQHKEPTKWEWELVMELLEGPLRNPAHLSSAMKTKFIKRILSFFRPEKHMFSEMDWVVENIIYVRVACQLLEVLLQTEEGVNYLKENPLIKEISSLLKAEVKGSTKAKRLLNPDNVLKTMAREYFTMLGPLSSCANGLTLMKHFNIFDYLHPMCELQGRDDLIFLILTSLDYNITQGHARVLLSKSLTSVSTVVRFYATRHMRVLLRAGVNDFSSWGVYFLVKQLGDEDNKVRRIATSILDEAVDEAPNLKSLIEKNPDLVPLGPPGLNLLLRFLSVDGGFNLLKSEGFLEQQMEEWKNGLNKEYGHKLESKMAEVFTSSRLSTANSNKNVINLPPHLYGELVKTKIGSNFFQRSQHFESLVATLKNPTENPKDRRAAIWAIGHIGVSEHGIEFLEKYDIVQYLAKLTQTAPWLSIRGTCYYVLGMISLSTRGQEILEQLDWVCPKKRNVCVPKDVSTILDVYNYGFKGSPALVGGDSSTYPPGSPYHEIITWIGNLANHITVESANKSLKRTKSKHPEYFKDSKLVVEVFNMLESYDFRLPVRRFIQSLIPDSCFSDQFFQVFEKTVQPKQSWIPPELASHHSFSSSYKMKQKMNE